jgi:hypothetical protein
MKNSLALTAIIAICLFVGFVVGHATGTTDGDAAAYASQKRALAAEDSLDIYREFADRAITLLDALGIDDDSVDPFYDGDDAKAYAVSSAYRRFCDAYNKLAGIDSLQQLPPAQTRTQAR